MIRTLVTRALNLILGLFFRRIEVAGLERVPPTGPVLFAINHPNGLIDPVLVLCKAPRPVAFLGKAPLLTMPVIGTLVRALDTIPVYRPQDPGSDVRHNRDTFARARALLERGGTIAIAPEGTSHGDPRLKPFKTGAARIALGAGTSAPVAIVPVGLFYTEKAVFRSSALVLFGPPIRVAPSPVDEAGEPPSDRVGAVTETLTHALASLVAEADDHEQAALIARVERILSAALPTGHRDLDEAVAVRQALAAGYRRLRGSDPTALDKIVRRVDRLEAAFRTAGLDPTVASPAPRTPLRALADLGRLVARLIAFLPLAIPGFVLHYPAYRLIGFVSTRLARGHEDVVATIKVIAGAVFYPITWLVVSAALGRAWGWSVAVIALLLAPLSGFAAVKLVERFDRFLSAARAFGFHLTEPEHFDRLVAERRRLRDDLLALATRLDLTVKPASR